MDGGKAPFMASDEKEYAMEVEFNNERQNELMTPVHHFARHIITTKYELQQWQASLFLVKRMEIKDHRDLLDTFMLKFTSAHGPVPISFSTFSLSVKSRGFEGRHSLFLAPVPSKPLLDIHQDFCEKLKEICVVDMKDSWIPMCPIGFDVPDDKLVQAMKLVSKIQFPLKGYVTGIGRTEYFHGARIDLRGLPLGFGLQNPENA